MDVVSVVASDWAVYVSGAVSVGVSNSSDSLYTASGGYSVGSVLWSSLAAEEEPGAWASLVFRV